MPDYIFKTYLADGREYFLYGETGDSRTPLTKKDFPFPESLLRLLYLDIWDYDGQIKRFDKLLRELYRTREESCARQLLPLLDELAADMLREAGVIVEHFPFTPKAVDFHG